jgi:hypothetical protein
MDLYRTLLYNSYHVPICYIKSGPDSRRERQGRPGASTKERKKEKKRIPIFYWDICFSRITKSYFVVLVIIRTNTNELP